MRRLIWQGSALALALSACHSGNVVSNASNGSNMTNVVQTSDAIDVPEEAPVTPCTSDETQDSLRRLIKAAIDNSMAASGGVLGMYQGGAGIFQIGSANLVSRSVDQISFSDTTLEEADAVTYKTACSTSLRITGDGEGEPAPRLSFGVQTTLEGERVVVTLPKPFEVQSAIGPLAAGLSRIAELKKHITDPTVGAVQSPTPEPVAVPEAVPSDGTETQNSPDEN